MNSGAQEWICSLSFNLPSQSFSQPQLTSLLKSLANLEWREVLRAVDMCCSWMNSPAPTESTVGLFIEDPQKLAVVSKVSLGLEISIARVRNIRPESEISAHTPQISTHTVKFRQPRKFQTMHN
jgi:hypothetical protein